MSAITSRSCSSISLSFALRTADERLENRTANSGTLDLRVESLSAGSFFSFAFRLANRGTMRFLASLRFCLRSALAIRASAILLASSAACSTSESVSSKSESTTSSSSPFLTKSSSASLPSTSPL
ncbi:hypothetical protein FBU59_006563, partial [Linderina macrospora]